MIAPVRRNVIVFAGGGTGGHLYPAVAVARALPSMQPLFVVPPDRGDRQRLDGEFRCIETASPRWDRGRVLYPGRLARAIVRARRLLRREEARAVVGLGSYASVPTCLAARSMGLPVYLMAFDAVPGKATRMLAPIARGIGLGSELARTRFPLRAPVRVTGTPLREELRRDGSPEQFGLPRGLPTLLVFGGSQGAHSLNRRIVEGIATCPDLAFQVIHVAGPEDEASVRDAYERMERPASVHGFVDDMGAAYAAADVVVCRGGASSVAECLALGKPAVFVPYPWHKDEHQTHNARSAARAGAAQVVKERELDAPRVRKLIETLLLSRDARASMAERASDLGRPAAAQLMATHLMESLGDTLKQPTWTTELGG
ncbi:MAG: UDP-N-acetylglucosamine--N-acetylmuramyl-(pentapeptide) pyrophosphoryl-undecaprenol N-acetylglucosamine transferase [Planctomycetota bacterium]